jgi:hypothetical protein
MLYVEEFKVASENLDKMMSYIKDALAVIDDLVAPYLKSVKVFQSTDDPDIFRVYYDIERRKDIESLGKEFNEHPIGKGLPARFYSLIEENSRRESYFEQVGSIGRYRFSSLPPNNKKYQVN